MKIFVFPVYPNTLCGWIEDAPDEEVTLVASLAGVTLSSVILNAAVTGCPPNRPFAIPGVSAPERGALSILHQETGDMLWENNRLFEKINRVHHPIANDASLVLGRRACFVVAHPDDEVLQFGGAILRHLQHGDPVKVAILTDANWKIAGQDDKEQRFAECRRAAACLGIEMPENLHFPDGDLAAHLPEATERLINLFHAFSPQVVYTHHSGDVHPDHEACSLAVSHAADSSPSIDCILYGEFYQPVHANFLLDISAVADQKFAACAEYVSQLKIHPYDTAARGLNAYRALQAGPSANFAEALIRILRPERVSFLDALTTYNQPNQHCASSVSTMSRRFPASATACHTLLPEPVPLREAHYPELDISVVTYHSDNAILAFFKSLLESGYPASQINLHFCDHSGVKECMTTLNAARKKWGNQFRSFQIHQRRNSGFGAGHNFNARHSQCEFLLVTNLDLEFTEGSLRKLMDHALGSPQTTGAWEMRQFPFEHPKIYDPVSLAAEWISGACVLIRKSAFDSVKGFDPVFFLYWEDTDFSFRLRQAGWVLRYCPDCTVVHHKELTPKTAVQPQHRFMHYSNWLIRVRYGTPADRRNGFRAMREGWKLARRFKIPRAQHWMEQLDLAWRTVRMRIRRKRFKLPPRISALRLFEGESIRDQVKKLPHPSKLPPGISALRPFEGESIRDQVKKLPLPSIQQGGSRSQERRHFKEFSFGFLRKGETVRASMLPPDPPLVSIIVRTTGRRNGLLREALQSLANQTYPSLEVIVAVDDAPADLTPLRKILQALPLRAVLLPLPRCGRSAAGNAGLAAAAGEFLGFLDDDDLLFSDHVELLASSLLSQVNAPAAYAWSMEVPTLITCPETPLYRETGPRYGNLHRFSHTAILHHNLFAIQSVLFRRPLFHQIGGFDTTLECLEDWDLWVRYSQLGEFYCVGKATSAFRTPALPEEIQSRQTVMDKAYPVVWEKHNIRTS